MSKLKVLIVIVLLLAVATAIPVKAGEKLYNGIVLPDKWPPHRTAAEMRTNEPMPVPYLDNPPMVIPIDVGRQLFVDNFLIADTTLKRVWHKTEYYKDNPILKPDTRWEKAIQPATAMPFSGGVWYEPKENIIKMWYTYTLYGGGAFATSKDGIKWEKPTLDVIPNTNIVFANAECDSLCVSPNPDSKDPQKKYIMTVFHRDAWREAAYSSADGIHWSGPTWGTNDDAVGDRTTSFYNPFRKVWVYSIRDCLFPKNPQPKPKWAKGSFVYGRAKRYWECKDPIEGIKWHGGPTVVGADWKENEPTWWTWADKYDLPRADIVNAPPELYNLDCAPYESLMLGLFAIWHFHPEGRPKVNELYWGFSRDGFHFSREFREPVMPISKDKNAWNAGNVQSVGGLCLVMGDKLYFYCSGRSAEPNGLSNEKENTTGLAFLRRDGFASMEAGKEGGVLTTRPVTFKGKYMFVNADCKDGELTVEALDKNGKVIEPFTKENSITVKIDKTLWPVAWKGAADLGKISGKEVKFRFHLKNGSLYSFWVSTNENGASYGYVAGGGLGFKSNMDTVGLDAYKKFKEEK